MDQPTYSFTVPAPPSTPPTAPSRWSNKALWLVGIGLLANAAALALGQFGRGAPELVLDSKALGQAAPGAGMTGTMLGARGLYMMPAQLGMNVWGVYLMDVDAGTICVYRALPDSSHLKLMAARSFRNDRFLEDFNNEGLRPKDVQKLVEEQRQRMEQVMKDTVPSVDQNPKPDPNLPDAVPGDTPGGTMK